MVEDGNWLVLNMTGRDIYLENIENGATRFQFESVDCADQLTALRDALAGFVDNGLSFEALDGLAIVTGPGNFTSIRIGLALFRGIGVSARCVVKGVNLFEIAATSRDGDALLMRDARGGRVYIAEKHDNALENYRVVLKDEAHKIAAALGLPLVELDEISSGKEVLNAVAAWRGDETEAKPFYLRPPDAAPSSYVPPKILDA